MLDYEKRVRTPSVSLVAGTDEAGRGPLAGPLVVAAVLFDPAYENELINDSKKLTARKREALFDVIAKKALAYSIVVIEAPEIDKINILNATKKGMEEALLSLSPKPDYAITDYVPLKGLPFPHEPLVKADAKALSVAAASILAKVTRDRIMDELDEKYPEYGFKRNKGYGTKEHLLALERLGPIEGVHRFSYEPVRLSSSQLRLF